jgi:hypothetical protein
MIFNFPVSNNWAASFKISPKRFLFFPDNKGYKVKTPEYVAFLKDKGAML